LRVWLFKGFLVGWWDGRLKRKTVGLSASGLQAGLGAGEVNWAVLFFATKKEGSGPSLRLIPGEFRGRGDVRLVLRRATLFFERGDRGPGGRVSRRPLYRRPMRQGA